MGLRRRSLSFLISIGLALLVAQPSARAEAKRSINLQTCGTTIEENLTAARKALQSDDKATRAALACLIEATSTLDEKLRNDEQGQQQSGMLRFPSRSDGPKLSQ